MLMYFFASTRWWWNRSHGQMHHRSSNLCGMQRDYELKWFANFYKWPAFRIPTTSVNYLQTLHLRFPVELKILRFDVLRIITRWGNFYSIKFSSTALTQKWKTWKKNINKQTQPQKQFSVVELRKKKLFVALVIDQKKATGRQNSATSFCSSLNNCCFFVRVSYLTETLIMIFIINSFLPFQPTSTA